LPGIQHALACLMRCSQQSGKNRKRADKQ
jgi:hypothetical protein